MESKGFVVWLYGLPSAGKTTLAKALVEQLSSHGIPTLRIDGDVLRSGLCSDLGFSDHDREENVRRAANVAKLAANCGIVSIASLITPMRSLRELVRSTVGEDNLLISFVHCPVDECVRRDVKGLYAKAASGQMKGMTGLDGTFEIPGENEFRVHSSASSIDECVTQLLDEMRRRKFVIDLPA
jgi:adenylylsulfate kinase